MSNHLNDFNSIYNNLVAQEVEFPNSIKALFLLITLLDNWDTFFTTISNFVPIRGLTEANVANILLIEELNTKNNENSHGGNALYVKGRSTDKGQSQNRAWPKSKSCHRLKDMERYKYGKRDT